MRPTRSTIPHFRGNATRDRVLVGNPYQQWTDEQHVNRNKVTVVHSQETFYTTELKSHITRKNRSADGQYTRLSAIARHHEFIVYRSSPNLIFRNDPTSVYPPVAVLQQIEGVWFPLDKLTTSELTSLRPFTGAIGIDPSLAIATRRRSIKREGSARQKTTTNKHESGLKRQKCRTGLINSVAIR